MAATPTVLVVGGGSTGAGIARDLAMRGCDVTLVEQGNLTHGTTGRMHGLLHSGGRYAVSDEHSARQCIEENRVLQDIASHCVEMTGGLFVKRPEDSEPYFQEKLAACEACGIPADVLTGDEARRREPYLAADVEKAIAVPDGAVDPFRLVVANAKAAAAEGARIETHTAVRDLLVEDGEVVGAEVEHGTKTDGRVHGVESGRETIRADHVVNATGAWAEQLAGMAGVDVPVRASKGVMTITNVRQVDTVINRCRPKDDGDILVPHETTAILGTTDVDVDDPEEYPEEGWEVELMIEELSELVPVLKRARTIRSFWGVRPLYEPPGTAIEDPTDVTREFSLLDHAERDGLQGLTTIIGGKFTTYRLMAEIVADHVTSRFGMNTTCRTADVPLPGSEDESVLDDAMDDFGLRSPVARRSAERLGSRTREVLDTCAPNPVLCGCEAVTRAEVRDAIDEAGSDLNAVRIRTRASMGNCQGGFCAHRLAAELHPDYDEHEVREARADLFQERWKGQRHALWGRQLTQAAINYALHATTMNHDRDPADAEESIDFAAFDGGDALVRDPASVETDGAGRDASTDGTGTTTGATGGGGDGRGD